MKKLLLAICMLLAIDVSAQVTITQNDMPGAGDALYRTRAGINPFLNYAATGANHVWNFPNLTATTQDSAVYQTVASTNFVYALTYIDFFLNPNRANHAKPGVDIPFNNLLPVTNPYTFYYRSSSVYKAVGYGMELAGIPIPVIFSNHDEIYSLPINFGDTDSSFSAYNISLPTLAYYGYEQNRYNEVDGWGVINTPSGSFDALRIKTTLVGRDTINLDSLGIGFAIDRPVMNEYKWLSPGLQIPIMQVNTMELFGIQIITDIFFYDLQRSINVVQPLASVVCPGNIVTIPYDITGAFNQGGLFVPANIFRAQLSDMNGDFTNAVNIGSVTDYQSGTITATIPANTPPGNGYRIRVISTNPAFTGNDNGFDIIVTVQPVATATAGGATEFCEGLSVLLSAGTDPAYSYQWQLNGSDLLLETNADHVATVSGTYTVVVTNVCGNATSAPVQVIVNPLPEHTFAQASFTICNNNQVTLIANNTSGQSSLSYQWYGDGILLAGETSDSLVASAAGIYSLEISNILTGCAFTASATVIVDSITAPVITTSGSLTFCEGDSVVLDVVQDPGTSYQWQLDGIDISGATTSSITAMANGNYTVVATSTGGCTAASVSATSVMVNSLPLVPLITASGNAAFCAGGSVQLDVTPEPGVTYEWQLNGITIPNGTGTTITAVDGGIYTVTATGSTGCISNSDPAGFTVQVYALPVAPVITPNGPTVFCAGDSVTLSVIAVPGYDYQWSYNGVNISGAIFNTYTVADSSGSYTVFVTDMNGCSSSAVVSYQVDVNPLPASPVIIQSNDTLYASGSGDYQWYLNGAILPGATGSFYIPLVNGNYSVTVSDVNGCENISIDYPMVNVSIGESTAFSFNVFPNPSGGIFQVIFENENNTNSVITVFDPTGKEIFAGQTNEKMKIIDLSEVASGIYFLKIQQDSGAARVTKLVIQ
ncbi:MAG: T9SS type A sorting domain-containing protein [Bacteroidota bacterium]|nr:T9SS type A sorting domain-containing protein [Bacteroidota bacterium]